MLNRCEYCLTSALRGVVSILTNASVSKFDRETTTGNRPTNSGINPYFSRSSGLTSSNNIAEVVVTEKTITENAPPVLISHASEISPSKTPPAKTHDNLG